MKSSLFFFGLALVGLVSAAQHSDGSRLSRRQNRNGFRNGNKSGSANANSNSNAAAAASKSAAAAAAAASAKSGSSNQAASSSSSSSNNNNNGGIQSSLTLDKSVLQTGSAQNGNPSNGQVASLTSTNNFINFCAGQLLMNGTQTQSKAACNPIPMGMIVGQNSMPSGKFTNPKNLDTISANTQFDITMKINNLVTGNFVNPNTNYFSAPAQLDKSGAVIGHSHFVVEAIDSLTTTTVTNPLQFAFFKGVDPPAVNGVMTVTVPGGLPAGTYRLGSMNSAANHQPVLASIAQHGMFDDVVYFTVK